MMNITAQTFEDARTYIGSSVNPFEGVEVQDLRLPFKTWIDTKLCSEYIDEEEVWYTGWLCAKYQTRLNELLLNLVGRKISIVANLIIASFFDGWSRVDYPGDLAIDRVLAGIVNMDTERAAKAGQGLEYRAYQACLNCLVTCMSSSAVTEDRKKELVATVLKQYKIIIKSGRKDGVIPRIERLPGPMYTPLRGCINLRRFSRYFPRKKN